MATIEQNFASLQKAQKGATIAGWIYFISAVVFAFLGDWHVAFFLLILWLGVCINRCVHNVILAMIALKGR